VAAAARPLHAEAISPLVRAATDSFKSTTTTLFWVGEQSDAENDFIPNDASYWDTTWQNSFGGVDDPEHRDGHWPAGFRPRENPFYVALPYGEFVEESDLKIDARLVPWYRPGLSPLLKNRWVEIRLGDRFCYAQWEDVGPCEEDDFHYVFGMGLLPRNKFDAKAGLDLSPAVWFHLGMTDNAITAWRFVEASDVLPGPWTEIVTISDNNR
jgi:hypothetical protein